MRFSRHHSTKLSRLRWFCLTLGLSELAHLRCRHLQSSFSSHSHSLPDSQHSTFPSQRSPHPLNDMRKCSPTECERFQHLRSQPLCNRKQRLHLSSVFCRTPLTELSLASQI